MPSESYTPPSGDLNLSQEDRKLLRDLFGSAMDHLTITDTEQTLIDRLDRADVIIVIPDLPRQSHPELMIPLPYVTEEADAEVR